ncbi:MAG: AbrB/MazE/SpoVT family DNA-binding domain-containing protein [Cyanobacteria bacterium J06632_22]
MASAPAVAESPYSPGALVARTRIVKIGNSQGVRIPKLVLEQLGLTGEVELVVNDGQLVIRNVQLPRAGWASQFQAMAANGDDALLDADTMTDWDAGEWRW